MSLSEIIFTCHDLWLKRQCAVSSLCEGLINLVCSFCVAALFKFKQEIYRSNTDAQWLSLSCNKILTHIWCQSCKLVDNIVCAQCCLHRIYFCVPRRPLETAQWLLVVGWKWAHHCSRLSDFLSFCLSLLWEESAVVSSIISTGSYSDSSKWFSPSYLPVFMSSFHFSRSAILSFWLSICKCFLLPFPH